MMSKNDDLPVGRVLTRREILSLFGGAGAALVIGGSLTRLVLAQDATATAEATDSILLNCVASPQVTEGPYFVDEMLNRSDIRIDPTNNSVQAGIPMQLEVKVYNVNGTTCSPLVGAQVDVWHCNAVGLYSDEDANDTVGQKWLRGYQLTDEFGVVKFTTVYPGWYSGRTVHIHIKVRTYDADNNQTYEFTSQLFFDDALSDEIYASTAPYTEHAGRDTTNATDNIFSGASSDGTLDSGSGEKMMLTITDDGNGGYNATISIGIDTTLPTTDPMSGNPGSDGFPGGTPPGGHGNPPGNPPGQATATPNA